MRIGAAAKVTGLTVKAIRFYEAEGLLSGVDRSGPYRDLSETDVRTLHLIAHCRGLGFSVEEVRSILGLVHEAEPACPEPEAMVRVIEARVAATQTALRELGAQLERLKAVEAYVRDRTA